jgi:hypothetical protein
LEGQMPEIYGTGESDSWLKTPDSPWESVKCELVGPVSIASKPNTLWYVVPTIRSCWRMVMKQVVRWQCYQSGIKKEMKCRVR